MASSDFTNVRAESNAYDQITIRYTYAGSNAIRLYRSTDGSSYSNIQEVPAAYGSYPTLYDNEVTHDTLYYYKFSDDSGSTFTSAVTVKAQKHFNTPQAGDTGVALPAFGTDEDVNAENMDTMRSQLEAYLNNEALVPQRTCEICPTNGALILDCSEGCYTFIISQDEMADVNSISINCERFEIKFDIPEGTEIEICGWPEETSFTGDECYQAPASTPVNMALGKKPKYPCPNTRRWLTTSPCKGDYLYECYDTGSFFRNNTTRRIPIASGDCGCSSVFTGNLNEQSSTYKFTFVSGELPANKSSLEFQGYAGFSLLYKRVNSSCAGAPGSANIIQHEIGGFGADSFLWSVTGKPIFGFALNVPENVTIRDFSGHVFLFDYPNSRYVWGKYTNADIHAGEMPTVINTMAMSVITPTNISLIIDATGGNIYSDYDVILETNADTQTMAHTAITLNSEPTGAGLIWVANNSPVQRHTATITMPYESVMYWWG